MIEELEPRLCEEPAVDVLRPEFGQASSGADHGRVGMAEHADLFVSFSFND